MDNPITKAIALVGLMVIAAECRVTYQAVRKWEAGGLPRTEWTGETKYAQAIERLTKRVITKRRLLDWSQQARVAA